MNIIDLPTNTRITLAQANRLPHIKAKTQITDKTHPDAMAANSLAWEQETEKPEGDYILDAPQRVAGVWAQVWIERVYTVDEITAFKTGAIETINAHYQGIVEQLAERFPVFTQATWPFQLDEATAWLADNAAPTPFIDSLLVARPGVSKQAYCNGFITKLNNYKGIGGTYEGRRQKAVAMVNAVDPDGSAASKAAIDAILAAL